MRHLTGILIRICTLSGLVFASCTSAPVPPSTQATAPDGPAATRPASTPTDPGAATGRIASPPWWPQTTEAEFRDDIFRERKSFSGIEDVLAVGEDGTLAVRLTNSPRDVFLLDPREGQLTLFARPPEGDSTKDPAVVVFAVSSAWVGWISRPSTYDRNSWLLMARQRATGRDIVVARPDPSIGEEHPGLDTYPYPGLCDDSIVWGSYERDEHGDVIKAIRLKRLPDGPSEVIASLPSATDWQTDYITMPEVCDNGVVWFKGHRDFGRVVLFADTYLYDPSNGATTKLNTASHASMPRISRDHVVWVERSTEPTRVRGDIVLHDRHTGETVRLNPEADADHEWENYNPSLGSRFVTWWNSRHDAFPLYDMREHRLDHIAGGGFATVRASYITWMPPRPSQASTAAEPRMCWWARLAE